MSNKSGILTMDSPNYLVGELQILQPAGFLTLGSSMAKVSIELDTLDVSISPGLSPDAAAKTFWNAVCQVVGKPLLFPPDAT